jgi:hypothetical protein
MLVRADPRKTRPAAEGMAELLTKKTQLQWSLWATMGGAPLGTLAFTTLVQSLAELDAGTSPLALDEEYLNRLDEWRTLVAEPPVDRVVEILHNSGGEYRRGGLGAVGIVVTMQVANARFGAATKWSIEMADLVSEITGHPSMLGRGVVGEFGTLAHLGTVPDVAGLDAAYEALGKDHRYLTKLDEMGDMFLPGSGRVTHLRRVA